MSESLTHYIELIRNRLYTDYPQLLGRPGPYMPHPFLTIGSAQYADLLFDWDSWLCNVALRQILKDIGDPEALDRARTHERGSVLNFLHYGRERGAFGWIPVCIRGHAPLPHNPEDMFSQSMHKPCLAQHAAFLIREDGGDAEWIRELAPYLQYFLNNYLNHHRHECGLLFWLNDFAIGVDNDPCTYGRPDRTSGSIYLNTMMYRELLAAGYVLDSLGLGEVAAHYRREAEKLHAAIQEYCWDERDGFFYSVDFTAKPVERRREILHAGNPRDWPCLIMRIGVWSGFMALWSGVATPEQAERCAVEHYRNEQTFGAPFGVRSLSRMEKMYDVRATNNPSSWLGPIWGIANYLTFRGFVRYDLKDDATDIAEKTIRLFGRDLDRFGEMHEYYQPENGEPILNRGFHNWNCLVLNMIDWLEGKPVVEEY